MYPCCSGSVFVFRNLFLYFSTITKRGVKHPLTCGNAFRYFVRNFALTATDTLPCSPRVLTQKFAMVPTTCVRLTLILYRPGPPYVVPPRTPPSGQLRAPKREGPVCRGTTLIREVRRSWRKLPPLRRTSFHSSKLDSRPRRQAPRSNFHRCHSHGAGGLLQKN